MARINLSEEDGRELGSVLTRAATDVEYRAQLLTDPHAAIEAETGTRLPEQFRIRFVEKAAELDAMVVLPDFVNEEAELTEDELAAVAGGAEEEAALICWNSCKETCEKTCAITGLSL